MFVRVVVNRLELLKYLGTIVALVIIWELDKFNNFPVSFPAAYFQFPFPFPFPLYIIILTEKYSEMFDVVDQ